MFFFDVANLQLSTPKAWTPSSLFNNNLRYYRTKYYQVSTREVRHGVTKSSSYHIGVTLSRAETGAHFICCADIGGTFIRDQLQLLCDDSKVRTCNITSAGRLGQ